MEHFYSAERNVQILMALMKAHGVRKVVASPGATNVCLVASLQHDPFFQLYSSVDERSAAYIACGLAAESGEPVALSCTGATASRNYIPGLTEAFYRKLPVLAITSIRRPGAVGQHLPQVVDRTQQLKDMVMLSVQAPIIRCDEDEWNATVQLNRALLALRHRGGGPVHINLETEFTNNFTVRELPAARVIRRYVPGDALPELTGRRRIAVFAGAHLRWSDALSKAVDDFCAASGAVVICDQTSNYRGKYRVLAGLVASQKRDLPNCCTMDLMIHIGEISGGYLKLKPKEVWRVSPDGELRDTFRALTGVFEMEEAEFFRTYAAKAKEAAGGSYLNSWQTDCEQLLAKMPELPFSNIWIAQQSAGSIPDGSLLYLSILNSLRTWNFFETPDSVTCYSNTGGFGIDGGVSTLLGASLANPNRLCFGVIGDLNFFYDMNAAGNRHVGANMRIMLINNGCGTEFKNYGHFAAQFDKDTDPFIAARGHYGQRSRALVRHYAEDLGFEYLTADDKESYLAAAERFLTPEKTDRPMLFEVFTDSTLESEALKAVSYLSAGPESATKAMAKRILGEKNVRAIKQFVKK